MVRGITNGECTPRNELRRPRIDVSCGWKCILVCEGYLVLVDASVLQFFSLMRNITGLRRGMARCHQCIFHNSCCTNATSDSDYYLSNALFSVRPMIQENFVAVFLGEQLMSDVNYAYFQTLKQHSAITGTKLFYFRDGSNLTNET